MTCATDPSKEAITFEGDRLKVRFDSFGPRMYELFLKVKALPESTVSLHREDLTYTVDAPARYAAMLGVTPPTPPVADLPFAAHLFDDQSEVLAQAMLAKRFAVWCGCGWGKTALTLEWARHVVRRTAGRVLIVTVNEVVPQWLSECAKFYGDSYPLLRLRSRQQMREWMRYGHETHPSHPVAVTNYEKWNPESIDEQVVHEARHLAGVALDENRLKTGGGKQKWALVKSCRGIEYKLSCTATPAPNDLMEFASQGAFLERMRTDASDDGPGEIIWTYFRRDEKTHRWTVKPHAREAFFRFMSSWSIYVNDPRRYGWRLDHVPVPEPTYLRHEIEPTEEQKRHLLVSDADPSGQLTLLAPEQGRNFVQANRLSQVAKGFRYLKAQKGKYERIDSRKPGFVADLIASEVAGGHQVLVWTVFDAEAELTSEALAARGVTHDVLTGKTKPKDRPAILDRFRTGESPVLVSPGSMLGWGMNFQCCTSMVFSGLDFSFEKFYQQVRRAFRHGQSQSVRVHLPIVTGLEEDAFDAIDRKQEEFLRGIREQEDCYVRARGGVVAA